MSRGDAFVGRAGEDLDRVGVHGQSEELPLELAASDAIANSGRLMAVAVTAALVTDLVLLPAFFARSLQVRVGRTEKVSES